MRKQLTFDKFILTLVCLEEFICNSLADQIIDFIQQFWSSCRSTFLAFCHISKTSHQCHIFLPLLRTRFFRIPISALRPTFLNEIVISLVHPGHFRHSYSNQAKAFSSEHLAKSLFLNHPIVRLIRASVFKLRLSATQFFIWKEIMSYLRSNSVTLIHSTVRR